MKNKSTTPAGKRIYWRSVSGADVCECFDVDRRTVEQWRDGGCPWDAENKRYDLGVVHKWLLEREKNRAKGTDETLTKQKTRVEIERIEAQIEKLRGTTIPKGEHVEAMKNMALEFRGFIEAAINRNYQEFVAIQDAHAAHAVLKGFWGEVLKKWGYCKPYNQEEGDGKRTGKKKRGRVGKQSVATGSTASEG